MTVLKSETFKHGYRTRQLYFTPPHIPPKTQMGVTPAKCFSKFENFRAKQSILCGNGFRGLQWNGPPQTQTGGTPAKKSI